MTLLKTSDQTMRRASRGLQCPEGFQASPCRCAQHIVYEEPEVGLTSSVVMTFTMRGGQGLKGVKYLFPF
jgi:hypothetical protein